MRYDIAAFWKGRLTVSGRGTEGTLAGWRHVHEGLTTFLEAPLDRGSGFGDAAPEESGVILVSAPGAVGKSTLARQIAFETGAMLLDLAEAEPVGANTLVGGLARTALYEPFRRGEAALIIDGLDEARIRVTQDGFAAFLRDAADLAREGGKPVVLLGRTAAVQEAWLGLCDQGIEAPVLEIGYYDPSTALEFAKVQAQHIRRETDRREPDGRALDLLLKNLRAQTKDDGGTFAGYSPVLVALAKQVADPEDPDNKNTQDLISRIERGEQQITLDAITRSILVREQGKLRRLALEDETLRDKLYGPDEQLSRLVAHLYPGNTLPALPQMSNIDHETYTNALESWVPEHPFLDGDGRAPSSAVFGGLIAAEAMRAEASAEAALSVELDRGTAINPFLAEFYVTGLDTPADAPTVIPADHVGILYASLRARLSLGETASLRIDGEIDSMGDVDETAEVEINRSNRDGVPRDPLRFTSESDGHIRFGPQVEDVDITAPLARVSIGHGSEAVFAAPVFIEAAELTFDTDRVVAELSPRPDGPGTETGAAVHLAARTLNAPRVVSRPVRRGDVTLELSWPGATAYPWTDYAVVAQEDPDPRLDEALRRLKKILRLFRSHGRNQLAKYRDAIDHRRRIKGAGRCVRDQLLEEEVLTLQGSMYYLDPDRLMEVVGLNFQDVRTTRTTPATMDFLHRALAQDD